MNAMTGPEFQSVVTDTSRDYRPYSTEDFGVVSASVLSQVAISPENFSKDDIVNVIQKLCLRMPTELVLAGTLHTMDTMERMKPSDLTD